MKTKRKYSTSLLRVWYNKLQRKIFLQFSHLPWFKRVFLSIVHSLFIDCLYILLRLYNFKMCTENICNLQKKIWVSKSPFNLTNRSVNLSHKYQYLPWINIWYVKIIFVKPQCTKLDWFFKCCLQHVNGVTAVNSLHGEKNIFTLSF